MHSVEKSREHVEMFPPKSPVTREEPRTVVNFRMPQSIKDFLEEAESQGYTQTDVVIVSIEILRDIMATIGGDWWAILREASESKQPHGVLLGKLVAEALRAQSKKK